VGKLSTGFPQRGNFSTLSPGFSTKFFQRNLAFSRLFLDFFAKPVENSVETVENLSIFPQWKRKGPPQNVLGLSVNASHCHLS